MAERRPLVIGANGCPEELPDGDTVPGAGGATDLDGLSDVDVSTNAPIDCDSLKFDAASGLWLPASSPAFASAPIFLSYEDNDLTNIPIPAGDNRIAIFMVSLEDGTGATGDVVTDVEWDGVSGTPLYDERITNDFQSQIAAWYWLEADIANRVGTDDFAVTTTGGISEEEYAIYFFENVDQANPISDQDSTSANDTTAISITLDPVISASMAVFHGKVGQAVTSLNITPALDQEDDQLGTSMDHVSGYLELSSDAPAIYTQTSAPEPNRNLFAGIVLRGT